LCLGVIVANKKSFIKLNRNNSNEVTKAQYKTEQFLFSPEKMADFVSTNRFVIFRQLTK